MQSGGADGMAFPPLNGGASVKAELVMVERRVESDGGAAGSEHCGSDPIIDDLYCCLHSMWAATAGARLDLRWLWRRGQCQGI